MDVHIGVGRSIAGSLNHIQVDDTRQSWGDFAQPSWLRYFGLDTIVTQYSMNSLDVFDMNGNGHVDIVTCEHKGPHLRQMIFENDGRGRFEGHVVDLGRESHLGARVADMNGNGAPDLLSIGWDQPALLHLWRNDDANR